MSDEKKTGILDHLRELRKRLLWSILAVVIASFICFFFVENILDILKVPAGDIDLYVIEMTEGFTSSMRIAIMAGIIVSMPVLIYQFLMFVIPALTHQERRAVYIILPVICVMFIGGILFGYFYLIPPATRFLLDFSELVGAIPEIRLSDYINVVTRLLIAIGILFELPVVTTFLARMGIITSQWLASRRRIMIIFSFVLAAIITPTFDAVNQSIVAGTMIILYEISIWLAWLVQKRRQETDIEVNSGEQ
jgi:sec-independent protein translocase protein TatC